MLIPDLYTLDYNSKYFNNSHDNQDWPWTATGILETKSLALGTTASKEKEKDVYSQGHIPEPRVSVASQDLLY